MISRHVRGCWRAGLPILFAFAFASVFEFVPAPLQAQAPPQTVDTASQPHPGVFSPAPDTAAAADPRIEAQTRALASELRCPVCQGMSIEDSPTELSNQMKSVIREQLRAGRTPDEVKAYFVDRYGEWILLKPTARGVNLLVYVLPWLALLAGAGVVWYALRRWTRPTEAR